MYFCHNFFKLNQTLILTGCQGVFVGISYDYIFAQLEHTEHADFIFQ